MVFENLKATFSEHLTHTSFISRKVGFSRRCPHVPPRAAYLDRDGVTPVAWVNREISDQTGDADIACLLAGNKLRFRPHKNSGGHRGRRDHSKVSIARRKTVKAAHRHEALVAHSERSAIIYFPSIYREEWIVE